MTGNTPIKPYKTTLVLLIIVFGKTANSLNHKIYLFKHSQNSKVATPCTLEISDTS